MYLCFEYPKVYTQVVNLKRESRVEEVKQVLFVWYAGNSTPQDCAGMIAQIQSSYRRS